MDLAREDDDNGAKLLPVILDEAYDTPLPEPSDSGSVAIIRTQSGLLCLSALLDAHERGIVDGLLPHRDLIESWAIFFFKRIVTQVDGKLSGSYSAMGRISTLLLEKLSDEVSRADSDIDKPVDVATVNYWLHLASLGVVDESAVRLTAIIPQQGEFADMAVARLDQNVVPFLLDIIVFAARRQRSLHNINRLHQIVHVFMDLVYDTPDVHHIFLKGGSIRVLLYALRRMLDSPASKHASRNACKAGECHENPDLNCMIQALVKCLADAIALLGGQGVLQALEHGLLPCIWKTISFIEGAHSGKGLDELLVELVDTLRCFLCFDSVLRRFLPFRRFMESLSPPSSLSGAAWADLCKGMSYFAALRRTAYNFETSRIACSNREVGNRVNSYFESVLTVIGAVSWQKLSPSPCT